MRLSLGYHGDVSYASQFATRIAEENPEFRSTMGIDQFAGMIADCSEVNYETAMVVALSFYNW